MSSTLVGGLAAAIGAAALYGSAPVAQAVAAGRAAAGTGVGLGLVRRLAHQPVWLFGTGCEIVGFLLEAYAFSLVPATLVAPVAGCDLLVFVLAGRRIFGHRHGATGVAGAVVMTAGIVLLGLAFAADDRLGRPASGVQLIVFGGLCAVVALLAAATGGQALAAGHRRTATTAFSIAAGGAYGFATMATRQVGRTFSPHHPWQLLATPTPYVLVGCSILAIALTQRALQIRPALAFPMMSAVSAFLPVVLGASLLGDQVPAGGAQVVFVAALVLVAVGLTLIGWQRSGIETR